MKTKQPSKLQTYLTGLSGATLLATTSNAAVVQMDIGAISGVNGGVASERMRSFSLSTLGAGLTGTLSIFNNYYSYNYANSTPYTFTGFRLGAGSGSGIATNGGKANPAKFTLDSTVDNTKTFSSIKWSGFRTTEWNNTATAPTWGPGSYMGFKDTTGHYGWLEVTWNPDTSQFQVFSGAYENVAGNSIQAGAIPEPSSLALLVAGAGATFALHRRKAAAKA